jgi:hypothetical protein
MVTSTRVIRVGSSGRSWSRRWYREVEHFTFRALQRARRAGSRPATTARPIRPVSSGSAGASMPRGDDLLPRGLECGGEAGPVRVGSGRLGGGGHCHAQRLAGGQQRPQFLLGAGPVAGAEHVPAEQGVAEREVGDLDFVG